ncbi:MAG: hypothetical protein F6J95_013195 [Leptolyngbya sp. SIO1E4]|nr:hypothetical protein [Leptolyngbya sp. SIO1E4]
MEAILNDPLLQGFLHDLWSQKITLATGPVWLLVAIAFSILGGALGGVVLARKDLGSRLAAMIGGLYGPAAMIPAATLGLALIGFGLAT